MKFGSHLEVQRYIDSPSGVFAWRSYMAHVVWRTRDWWVSFSLPVRRTSTKD